MICFPNAKINLGLNITEKRSDGFHNIETIFYPVNWCDALEIIEAKNSTNEFNLHLSGIPISGTRQDNLLYKAYQLLKQICSLPSIDVYLHKAIPMGAGLGGGSSDAAFFINLLCSQFQLPVNDNQRINIAKQLGSDCAFFLNNKPVFAEEKGDVFTAIDLNLSNYHIAVIYPNVHSNTKEAYSLVKPQQPNKSLLDVIKQPIETWKNDLLNDFEISIFNKYPVVEKIKTDLYNVGATYACMSGSGSSVFGIFKEEPQLKYLTEYKCWQGKMM